MLNEREEFGKTPVHFLALILDPRNRGASLNQSQRKEALELLQKKVLKNPMFEGPGWGPGPQPSPGGLGAGACPQAPTGLRMLYHPPFLVDRIPFVLRPFPTSILSAMFLAILGTLKQQRTE